MTLRIGGFTLCNIFSLMYLLNIFIFFPSHFQLSKINAVDICDVNFTAGGGGIIVTICDKVKSVLKRLNRWCRHK